MERKDLIKQIEEWAIEKKIDKKVKVKEQLIRTTGEVNKFINSLNENNINKIIESVGDVFISLVIGNLIDKHVSLKYFTNKDNEIPLYANQKKKTYLIDELIYIMKNMLQGSYKCIDLKEPPEVYWGEDIRRFIKSLENICNYYGLNLDECIKTTYRKINK